MKHTNVFKNAMMVLCAVFAFGLASCGKLQSDDEIINNDHSRSLVPQNVQIDTIIRDNRYIGNDWYIKVLLEDHDTKQPLDSMERTTPVGGIDVIMYPKDTTEVSKPGFTSKDFYFQEPVKRGGYINDLRRVTKTYSHTLDLKGKGKGVEVSIGFNEARTKLFGKYFECPDREAELDYVGAQNVSPDYIGEDKGFLYYRGEFQYSLTAKTLRNPEIHKGYLCERVAQTPDPKIINKKVGDKGFEPKTYFDNGNLKTGRSWMKIIDVWDDGRETEEPIKEEVLNFWQGAPGYATEYPTNFTVSQMGSSMGSESRTGSRNGSTSEISVRKMEKVYNSGLTAGGTNYAKRFTLGREIATWSDGTYTFEMPSPEYENVYVSGFNTDGMTNTSVNGVNYERKLNTIDIAGKIAGGNMKLQAQTELRVAKAEEPETFTETIISKGLRRLSSSTAYVWARIRRTSSKGGYTEVEKGVNINFFGTPDGEEEFIVPFFDTPASKSLSVGPEQKGSSRGSGDFTITAYARNATMKTENVSRNVVLTYEKPTLRLQKGNSFEDVELPYVMYGDLVCQSVQTSSLINSMAGEKEWERKFYSYTLGATEKASETGTDFSENPTTFVSNAVLKVAKDTPDDPRETPSWLGKPEWAKYTRVQSESGAKFEDMVVFGYTNGVVMAPNGKINLESGVFAYTDADASKHGVEKCAKGSCYSGVWTGSKWIPAKITESDGRWIYTGYGKSHTVMANNAINLGIGKDVTHTPKHQSYEITDNGNKITIHYSKNNASLSETDLISLR